MAVAEHRIVLTSYPYTAPFIPFEYPRLLYLFLFTRSPRR